MNKKTNFALLLLLCVIVFSGCGPKRYGCGPRRCEVKLDRTLIPTAQKLNAAFA
jgi:hypothetical protein